MLPYGLSDDPIHVIQLLVRFNVIFMTEFISAYGSPTTCMALKLADINGREAILKKPEILYRISDKPFTTPGSCDF
jgi:hypothetical protein